MQGRPCQKAAFNGVKCDRVDDGIHAKSEQGRSMRTSTKGETQCRVVSLCAPRKTSPTTIEIPNEGHSDKNIYRGCRREPCGENVL